MARCLARWGLTLVALRDAAERSPAATQWLAQQQPAARAHGASRRWWCGGLAAPAKAAAGTSRGLLVAVDARGRIAWLPVASLGLQDAWIDFLARLQTQTPGPVAAWLHGLDLRRATLLNNWIAAQPRLQVLACPIPLARRARAGRRDPPARAAARWLPILPSSAAAVPPRPWAKCPRRAPALPSLPERRQRTIP